MTEETHLIEWNRIKSAIAQCEDISIMSQMNYNIEAIQKWAKQSRQSLEAQNEIAEYRLHLNRKQGEWIEANIPEEGGKPPLPAENSQLAQPTLAEAGIGRNDSPSFRTLAKIPEAIFEQFIAETKAKSEELTTKGMLRYYAIKVIIPNARRNRPLLPPGVYNVIYADPPWQYDNTGVNGAAEKHYHTLAPLAIAYYEDQLGTKIQDKISDNAALFLWTTNPFLEDAFDVIESWGFEYKTNIVWVKTNLKKPGAGFYVRGRHELLLICTRGSFVPDMTNKEPIGSVIDAPVQEHSKKPPAFYELIEKLYPPGDSIRHLELFARNGRRGWTSWGDELQISSEIPGGEGVLQ